MDYVFGRQLTSREKMQQCIERSRKEFVLFHGEIPAPKSREDIEAEQYWRRVDEMKKYGKTEFQSEYIVYAGERH